MHDKKHWDKRYKDLETPPWDSGYADSSLIKIIEEYNIPPSTAIEIGSGTGTNSFWLESKGFTVTAVDISEIAVKQAKEKALEQNSNIKFLNLDFIKESIPASPFKFVFDRGCFHAFDTDENRATFAKRVMENISQDGLWLSLIGSSDSPPRDTGPPMRSAKDIILAVEPFFEILKLEASNFDSKQEKPAKAWLCLMKRI